MKSLKIPKEQSESVYRKQTTQWPKEKVQKDKQRSIKHKHKTKDGVTRTPLKMENSEIVITQYPGHDLHEQEWEGLSSDYVRFLKRFY